MTERNGGTKIRNQLHQMVSGNYSIFKQKICFLLDRLLFMSITIFVIIHNCSGKGLFLCQHSTGLPKNCISALSHWMLHHWVGWAKIMPSQISLYLLKILFIQQLIHTHVLLLSVCSSCSLRLYLKYLATALSTHW